LEKRPVDRRTIGQISCCADVLLTFSLGLISCDFYVV
jgi:hypothetical protein